MSLVNRVQPTQAMPQAPHLQINPLKKPMDLYTIPFSHFCEKARWGLAYYGVPYHEHKYLPMLHMFPMLWQTRGQGKFDRDSTPASTPVLRLETGDLVCDSSRILSYLSGRFGKPPRDLYPTSKVTELEKLFSLSLGPDARRIAYFYVLQHQEVTLDICRKNAPGIQTQLIDAMYGVWYAGMRRALAINESRAMRSLRALHECFALVDSMLSDGRRFLCGGRFTAADLTFAALAAPALWVTPEEGYGGYLSPLDMVPKDLKAIVMQLRERPAGEFALRMFREHKPKLRWVG